MENLSLGDSERSIIVRRGIRLVLVLQTTGVIVVIVARRHVGHHHARGHPVSVADRCLLGHELVRMSHAQGIAGIKCHLDKAAAGCCVAGITGVDCLGQSLLEFPVATILDSVLQRFKIRPQHCHHELALVGIGGGRELHDLLHRLQLVRGYRPVTALSSAVHDMKSFGKIGHEKRE